MSLCSCFGLVNNETDEEEEVLDKRSKSQEETEIVPEEPSSSAEPSSGAQEDNLKDPSNKNVRLFTFKQLVSATNNFATIIGIGEFGLVYQGQIRNQVVAVKEVNTPGVQGEREFLVETHMLSILSHPNLVTLVGYCPERGQRLLVYEYMPFYSLKEYLFASAPFKKPLDWNSRMKIALGVARGLEYLHHKANPPVIHRDLKSANILLGEGFHPKLSDFALAKFGPTGDQTHVEARVKGSNGYCAPEYVKTGKLTIKSDIYSFGIVLFELITGRKALDDSSGDKPIWFINWLRPLINDKKNFPRMVDPYLNDKYPKASLEHALKVASMCVRLEAEKRPSMTEVVKALEYLADDPSPKSTSMLHTKGKGKQIPSSFN